MAVAFVRSHAPEFVKAAGTTDAYALTSEVPAGNLLVAVSVFDNAGVASKPVISSISKAAGETNNWVFLGAARSTSTSAGAFASGEMWCIKTSVAWPNATSLTFTYDTTTVMKSQNILEYSGVDAQLRSTVGTAYSTTTTAASVGTTGTTPQIGDLTIGLLFGSNVAAAQAGDTDTTGGSWSTVTGVGSTGSSAATNNFGITQHKIVTTTAHQTYNNSAAMTAGNGSIVAILKAAPIPSGIIGTTGDFASSGTFTLVNWGEMAAPAANDLALLFWTHSSTSTEATPPSGFTKYGEIVDNNVVHALYTRVCTGSESGTISYALDGASRTTTCVLLIRGWVIDTITSAGDTGTDASHTAPDVTPATSGAAIIISNGERLTTGSATMTAPGGYTVAKQMAAVGTAGSFTGVAYEGSGGVFTAGHAAGVPVSPGAMVNSVAAPDVAMWSIALKPLVTSVVQAGYRFYEDGTETGATALAAQDTAPTVDVSSGDANLGLRMRLQSNSLVDLPGTDDWQLQSEKNASGTWVNVAPAVVLADTYPSSNYANSGAISSTIPRNGQSFLGNGAKLTRVGFWMNKSGTPDGTVVAHLYAHSGTFGTSGLPSTLLASSTTLLQSVDLPTTAGWVYFDFDGTVTLTNGTPYCIAAATTCTVSNAVLMGIDNSTPTHAGGYVWFDTSWHVVAGQDLLFEAYTEGTPPPAVPYDSPSLTGGAATTSRLTGGTGTFTAGKVSEDGVVNDLGWAGNNHTEVLYAVTLKASELADGNTLRFRVLKNTATTHLTYTQVPTINVTSGAPPPPALRPRNILISNPATLRSFTR